MTQAAALNPTEVRERLATILGPEELAHVEETAELARILAVVHGVDPERTELAALLHDIASGCTSDHLLSLAEEFGLDISVAEARVPQLLHGRIAAEVLRRDWNITDEELLDAVRFHITGSPHMSLLAKVIFVADKLSPDQDKHYGGLDPVREVAMTSLDEAILRLYAWRMDDLVSARQPLDETFVAARNRLIEYTQATQR
jgi:predicted HD superfamily hydrolase involved in NAD metabolism